MEQSKSADPASAMLDVHPGTPTRKETQAQSDTRPTVSSTAQPGSALYHAIGRIGYLKDPNTLNMLLDAFQSCGMPMGSDRWAEYCTAFLLELREKDRTLVKIQAALKGAIQASDNCQGEFYLRQRQALTKAFQEESARKEREAVYREQRLAQASREESARKEREAELSPATDETLPERSIRIEWSAPAAPCEECRYNHSRANTPFGPFLLTWKSWKSDPGFGFDETPWGETEYHGWRSVEEAQAWAEAEMERRIAECLANSKNDAQFE